MSLFDDPAMEEVIDEFTVENKKLIEEMENLLENFEDNNFSPASDLEKFGQIIDRIMGAAKSLGLDEMGKICELGKAIGYKSGQVEDIKLLEIVCAILFDAIDLLKNMNSTLIKKDESSFKSINTAPFLSRLSWLVEKFKDIKRSSCEVIDEEIMEQDEIDQLIAGVSKVLLP